MAFAYTGTVVYALKVDGSPNATKGGILYDSEISSVKAHSNKDGSGNIAYYTHDYYETVKLDEVSFKFVKGNEVKYVPVSALTDDSWTAPDGNFYKLSADNWKLVTKADGITGEEFTEYDVLHTVYLIPCTKTNAEAALYKNGSFDTWLMIEDSAFLAEYEDVADAQKATTAKPNCTTSQFFEDGYLADGEFYVELDKTFDTKLNVDGKIVLATWVSNNPDYVVWASHIFAKGVKNDKTGYDVATCLICKGEFAATNDEAVATKNGYKISTGFSYVSDDAEDVYDENAYDNGYDFNWGQTYAGDYKFCWQLKPGTTEEIGSTKPADTKTGVDSAKTFDAGIAMYVGMSLLSVAGSAVVIGKKKEF